MGRHVQGVLSTLRLGTSVITEDLVDETHGHINSAGCEEMATTVTAAHHSIWRHLYDSMHAAQKPKNQLKFVMLDKESNMSTLWRRVEFLKICSKEDLSEKAQIVEMTIPVKKSQETRYNLDPGSFFVKWLASYLLAGGRTQSPDCALCIPVSQD